MTVLAGAIGIFLLWWGCTRLYRALKASVTEQNRLARLEARAGDLSRLQERFATTEMSTEEFEQGVERALENPKIDVSRADSLVPAERLVTNFWEVHVHNSPPGAHLHLHLGE